MSDFASRHSNYSKSKSVHNKQNVGIYAETAEVEAMLDFFTSEQCTDLYSKALGTVAREYKETAKNYFKSSMPSAARGSQHGFKDKLIDAVRVSKIKVEGDTVSTKVHVLGVRSSGSGTYRARFFEGGTQARETKNEYTDSLGRTYKKGKPLGRIKALNYFQQAQSAMSNLTVSLDKVINDLLSKNAPK